MWWWKRKREKHDSQLKMVVARWMAGAILHVQKSFVKHMQRIEKRLSLRQRKIVFLAFLSLCGACLINQLLFSVLHRDPGQTISPVPLKSIAIPPAYHFPPPDSLEAQPNK